MKGKKRLSVIIILISIVFIFIVRNITMNKLDENKIDVVSSVSMDDRENIFVIADCRKINDKVEFAEEILQKYVDNSFDTIKFSTDLRKNITCLQVSVYSKKSHIKEGNSFMEIEYKLQQAILEGDIRKSPEQLDIFINGEKIKRKD